MSPNTRAPSRSQFLCAAAACVVLTGFTAFQDWQALGRLEEGASVRVMVNIPSSPVGVVELEGTLVAVTQTTVVVTLDEGSVARVVERADGAALIYVPGDDENALEVSMIERRGRAFDVTFGRDMIRRASARTGESHKLRGALLGGAALWTGATLMAELLSDDNGREVANSMGFGLVVGAPLGAFIGYKMAGSSFDWRVVYENVNADAPVPTISRAVCTLVAPGAVASRAEWTIEGTVCRVVADLMREGTIPIAPAAQR